MMIYRANDYKIKWLLCGLLLGTVTTLFLPKLLLTNQGAVNTNLEYPNTNTERRFAQYSKWPIFLSDLSYDINAWRSRCWLNQKILPTENSDQYYKTNYTKYSVCQKVIGEIKSIYDIKTKVAEVQYPSAFAEKIKKIFNNDEDLYAKALKQELHFVINKYSFEHTVYNPLRGRRPVQRPEVPIDQYLKETMNKTSQSCDLCNYQNMTAMDSLGRMENRHAYSAANAFKFDQWHSMFMPRQHDVTKLTFDQLKDVYTLAWKWILAVHKQSPAHRFPTLLWDSLPHGGASQVHPHIHTTVHSDHYYGQFESIRSTAEQYYRDYKSVEGHQQTNYFRALQDVHAALNLSLSLGGITVFTPITSRKEYDIVVLAENFDERLIEVIYTILQGYFIKLKQYSFSSCLYLQPLSSKTDDQGSTPVYFRIIPRGQASSLLSEVSSLDLLSIYNVNTLPANLFAEVATWFKPK
ncbi:unnamed protein product [Adineta ricciae]|uniref:Galactose-1-phosphate uridylyltransferase n=1 Tax=Adineta ricciae TaxID=249248 RepID=A0A814NJJ7_ADIRI|nr:unnamed protein product [Adineta ricciae]CAF1435748.1 unnamed protein product [Adineta ricciae]